MSVQVEQSLLDSSATRRFCVVCSRVYRDNIRLCPDDGTPLALEGEEDDADSQVGRVLGQYRLLRLLGEGGVGAVFEAEHVRLQRHVAIKLLHRDLANAEMVTRFFNEARAVNQIRHPNIIDVEDFVIAPTGERYMIMEFLKGEDLRSVLDREKTLDPERVAELAAQAASALAAVHRAGIIHRDLKPDNVFLVEKDGIQTCKLLDFGAAKFTESREGVTRDGMTMGTPKYMAPEQIVTNGVPDARCDIYALGMVMYEALAGRPAFVGDMPAILRAHLSEQVTPPSKLRGSPVPAVLEGVVLRCLRKDPAARYQNADELRTALRAERPERRLHTPLPFAVPKLPSDLSPETTLRMPKQGSRWGLIAALLAVVAAAGAIFALPLLRGDDGRVASASTPAPAPAPPAPPPAPAKPAAVTPAVAAPATITLTLTSSPEGAEIFIGDERKPLGKSPVTATIPVSQSVTPLVAKFPGGEEVVHRIIPNRALTLSFNRPVAAVIPTKRKVAAPAGAPAGAPAQQKKTAPQGREDTVDPFTFK